MTRTGGGCVAFILALFGWLELSKAGVKAANQEIMNLSHRSHEQTFTIAAMKATLKRWLWLVAFSLSCLATAQHRLDIANSLNTDDYKQAWQQATPDEVKTWLQSCGDVNARVDGWPPLTWAVRYNENPEVLKALIDAGTEIDAQADEGWTALMYATWYSNNSEIIKVLIDGGAEINAQSDDGMTPLMKAALGNENLEIIKMLLDAGAEINARNNDGMTPLMWAAWLNENPESVLLLLQAGADSTLSDSEGKRAIDYAKGNEALKGTDAYEKLDEASF
jgi:hypothetical protein